ncbi:hypothetical protein [Desulfoferrobacter suflitae]|uniref:hypothetical protein n=1 Tax=Desulfoferrobacter suflitae TaxID=2865782 RepID=UPI002164490D|nr:hypothetical protein [Desulfoferrobacter suflitae]MCK8600516.1 hypothetical protein [Desulfoferrobacter suflitae]
MEPSIEVSFYRPPPGRKKTLKLCVLSGLVVNDWLCCEADFAAGQQVLEGFVDDLFDFVHLGRDSSSQPVVLTELIR